jgi:hypothetical protein
MYLDAREVEDAVNMLLSGVDDDTLRGIGRVLTGILETEDEHDTESIGCVASLLIIAKVHEGQGVVRDRMREQQAGVQQP